MGQRNVDRPVDGSHQLLGRSFLESRRQRGAQPLRGRKLAAGRRGDGKLSNSAAHRVGASCQPIKRPGRPWLRKVNRLRRKVARESRSTVWSLTSQADIRRSVTYSVHSILPDARGIATKGRQTRRGFAAACRRNPFAGIEMHRAAADENRRRFVGRA
jgi:hypothetical protein